ncbi:superoxide dismutase family protein [Hyphococcus sp.]|uniref:superoxide dismutase family protein n=1 Tax=Hyphococcus sp. TaxID=2038636 RepID=UPI003CCB88C0
MSDALLRNPVILTAKNTGFSIVSLLLLMACGNSGGSTEAENARATSAGALAPSADWADAGADFVGADGAVRGEVVFKEASKGGVMLRVEVNGLAQGWHGIHLHQVGDCSDGAEGFKASGGHVNPDGFQHGLLNPQGHERADLPNLYAGAGGHARAEIFAPGLSLSVGAEGPVENGLYNLLDNDGFAVVVHENADDHMTQPIGGAGARVACAAVKQE